MIKRTSQASIISMCILDIDSRVKDKVLAVQKLLVEMSLLDKKDNCSLDEIKSEIDNIIEQGEIINKRDLSSILGILTSSGNVEINKQGCWTLSKGRQESLLRAIRSLDEIRNSFQKGIDSAIAKRMQGEIKTDELNNIFCIVENFLLETIRAEIIELSTGLVKFEDFVNAYDNKAKNDTLESRLRNTLGSEYGQLRISQITAGVRDYFCDLPVEGRKYLETLQVRVLGGELLKLDPMSGNEIKVLFRSRKIFLDTNVLISLFFECDDYHELIPDVISLTIALGCTLLVSDKTVDEFHGQIDKAERTYWKIRENELARKVGSEFDDVIVQTYFLKLKENPNLYWDGYISVYKNTEEYLFYHNILIEKIDPSITIPDSEQQRVEEILDRYKPEATPYAIQHDAYMMLVTEGYRKLFSLDELGSKVWFLTLDNGIIKSQKELKKQFLGEGLFILPTSAHITTWGAKIGKYQNLSTFVYEDYLSFLIKSKLGIIAVDREGISADIIELISKSIFDIKPLLSLPDSLVASTVKSLQKNEEAKILMDQISKEDEPQWKQLKQDQLSKMVLDSLEQAEFKAKLEIGNEARDLRQQLEDINNKLHILVLDVQKKNEEIDELIQKIDRLSKELEITKIENQCLLHELASEREKSIFIRIRDILLGRKN